MQSAQTSTESTHGSWHGSTSSSTHGAVKRRATRRRRRRRRRRRGAEPPSTCGTGRGACACALGFGGGARPRHATSRGRARHSIVSLSISYRTRQAELYLPSSIMLSRPLQATPCIHFPLMAKPNRMCSSQKPPTPRPTVAVHGGAPRTYDASWQPSGQRSGAWCAPTLSRVRCACTHGHGRASRLGHPSRPCPWLVPTSPSSQATHKMTHKRRPWRCPV